MNKNTFDIVKKTLIILFFIILIAVFIILLVASADNKFIKNIKEFTKDDTKVLYISSKDKYSDYPIKLFNKYDIEYLYIDSTDLSNFEKTKIEKIINSKHLSNIIIIFNEGKIIDTIIDYDTENNLNKFLQRNGIIPDIIGNIDGIIESIPQLLENELMLLYVPYKYVEGIDLQNGILKDICARYNIEYQMINAYLLSSVQQEKLNSILQISSVEDQIIIIVKNKKIIGSIRGIHKADYYLNELYSYNFIQEIDSYIEEINYDEFNSLLNSNNKNIILIGKEECKYCDEVISTLNTIIINYNISIKYINIGNLDSELSSNVENKLVDLGYSDGFTTPITIMIESNKLIDYVIGASSEDYFIDIFTENGIIK